ncbi:MAG TPA: DUF2721 domain-containing protein [Opitutales bacterium]|nr:DUF2721 domain-containing protein [Opitutales bacterium]
MPPNKLSDLVSVLQVAITPAILISGVGLVLLSMTNRFARAVDRTRELARQLRATAATDRRRLEGELGILYQRAQLIQTAIIFGVFSILFAALLIMTLFLIALLQWTLVSIVVLLFFCCLLSLTISLVSFIMDIRLSLKALRLELGQDNAETK